MTREEFVAGLTLFIAGTAVIWMIARIVATGIALWAGGTFDGGTMR